jgi:hypothetical protein
MLPRITRSIVDSQLKALGCKPGKANKEVPGQWWTSSEGVQFFVQACKDDPDSIDAQHLACHLGDIAKYVPPKKPTNH